MFCECIVGVMIKEGKGNIKLKKALIEVLRHLDSSMHISKKIFSKCAQVMF